MSKTIIKTDAEELLPELAKALLITPKSSPMPILENFLLDFRKGKSFVFATNLAQHFRTKIEASCDEEISFLVPAHLFTDLISNLKGTIDIEVLKTKITIKSVSGQYSLSILGVEDYPELPKIKKSDVMLYENVLQDIFLNTIAEVEYAVDKNGMRPAMCGIYVEPGKQPKIVSTNGIILSLRSLASESIGEGEGFIIPEEALQMLKKILPEKFTITRSEGKAFFSDGTMEFSTRLIGEKYPKYQAVIPKENEFEALVNRQELISVIKRLKLFKDKVETGMVIKFSAGRMIMEISNTLIGHTGKEWIESKHNLPDDFVIGVWPDYVLNSILAFNSEEVKLTFSTPSKAILITDPVNNENISLVMPRKVDELV